MDPVLKIKCVINACYGGFSLSEKAALRLYELGVRAKSNVHPSWAEPGAECFAYWISQAIERWDPRLVQVVMELGDEASGSCSKLKIVEGNAFLEISDHDGYEKARLQGGELY